jgi:zinc transporter ZupT
MVAALGWGALAAFSPVLGVLVSAVSVGDASRRQAARGRHPPEPRKRAGRNAGLVTALGFAVAAGMSNLS